MLSSTLTNPGDTRHRRFPCVRLFGIKAGESSIPIAVNRDIQFLTIKLRRALSCYLCESEPNHSSLEAMNQKAHLQDINSSENTHGG